MSRSGILTEIRQPDGFRLEVHKMLKTMDTTACVVLYAGRSWMIFMPYENRMVHCGSLNFIIKVLRAKYPNKIINGRFLEEHEQNMVPQMRGAISRV